MRAALEASRSDGVEGVLQGLYGGLRVEAPVGQLIVGPKNVLQWSHGVKNRVPLNLKLLLLLLLEPNFTLV